MYPLPTVMTVSTKAQNETLASVLRWWKEGAGATAATSDSNNNNSNNIT
jgi:hypothetical protein